MEIHGLPIKPMCSGCKHTSVKYLVRTCDVYSVGGVYRWKRLAGKCPMNGLLLSLDASDINKKRIGQQKQKRKKK